MKNKEILKPIRLLALDIDGVLTDGKIFWVSGTGWTRTFCVADGYGIKLLLKNGLDVAFLSGGDSESVRERAKWLKIPHVYLGDENKLIALEKIQKETGLKDHEIAFVGDELFDIPVLQRVGFSATVPHAPKEVKNVADYVTEREGGNGAVREICDLFLEINGGFKI